MVATASTCITRCWSSNATPAVCSPPGCVEERLPVMPASCLCCYALFRDSSMSSLGSGSSYVPMRALLCRCSMNSASFSASSTPSACLPTRSFNVASFVDNAGSLVVITALDSRSAFFLVSRTVLQRWFHQRRVCYKAEHTETGTNLRFLVTNLEGRSGSIFRFYNDRGECENRIEEFKNGFDADRLSCHRFRANAFRLLLHGFAYNLVNLFRLQLPVSLRSAQIETLRTQLFKIGARIRQTAPCVHVHLASGSRLQPLFQTVALAFNSS